MILRIYESSYLLEDIEAVKKYYPNIDDSTFMTLIALDPTYRDGSNSVGKYGKWILNLFKKGAISKEDFSEITPLLQQFTTYKNRVQNKDLNAYKTLDDLSNTLAQVVDDDSMLSDRQKLRFLKNVKACRVSTSEEDDYDVVLDTPKFIVYVPNTHEASMKLGKGTEWCTAHENTDWYNSYTSGGGKLYIIKNKQTGERWQYSDEKGDFLDQNDKEFNISELMNSDEKLSKFFEKFLGVDFYSVDKTLFYYGGKVQPNNRELLKKVVIDRSVTIISDWAFGYCTNLTSITIPDSVEIIGESAFDGCKNLTSITIPNSVMVIGGFAFNGCKNVTVYTDNEYAINYCNDYGIKVRPEKEFVSEYFKKHLKLRIKEDTACIASKTSYIDEDGLDANGIYYFGDKPKLPINWKDIFKKKRITKQIKEGFDGNMIKQYIEVDSKQVKDSGGWLTDYTMYMRIETTRENWLAFLQSVDVQRGIVDIPEDWITGYVFVFGDSDIYGPEDEEFDWECETEEEAYEWFDNYNGFDDEDEFDMDECLTESVIDESGMFIQLDDALEGLIGNVDDEEIDEAVRYFSTLSGRLGKKDKFSSIICYFCNEPWLDPVENISKFNLKPIYKNQKYDAFIGELDGKKFIADHFSNNFDFTVYATDEETINKVIESIAEDYE